MHFSEVSSDNFEKSYFTKIKHWLYNLTAYLWTYMENQKKCKFKSPSRVGLSVLNVNLRCMFVYIYIDIRIHV